MSKVQWMILVAIGLIAIVAFFTFRRKAPQPYYDTKETRNPFGNGNPSPPIGTSIPSGRPGAPVSPIPGTVGRVVQEIQTGVSAVDGLAKDVKTTVDSIRALFN